MRVQRLRVVSMWVGWCMRASAGVMHKCMRVLNIRTLTVFLQSPRLSTVHSVGIGRTCTCSHTGARHTQWRHVLSPFYNFHYVRRKGLVFANVTAKSNKLTLSRKKRNVVGGKVCEFVVLLTMRKKKWWHCVKGFQWHWHSWANLGELGLCNICQSHCSGRIPEYYLSLVRWRTHPLHDNHTFVIFFNYGLFGKFDGPWVTDPLSYFTLHTHKQDGFQTAVPIICLCVCRWLYSSLPHSQC